MQRAIRTAALATAAVLAGAGVTACGGGSTSSSGADTITYWATNQSASLDADKKILQPEIDKFTKQTGVKVELEVIPSADLLNRILAATTSGKGPDVLNIGNTWSASLQATGAFVPWDKAKLAEVGGASRFLPTALKSTGATGEDPMSLPLYTNAYELYYSKKLFKAAGISAPPKTWSEFVSAGRKLTKDTDGDGKTDQWGLGMQGASPRTPRISRTSSAPSTEPRSSTATPRSSPTRGWSTGSTSGCPGWARTASPTPRTRRSPTRPR